MGKLTEKQYDFLRNYRPADRHFTSQEEIAKVANELNIQQASIDDKCEMRNEVVRFYTELSELYIEYDEYGQFKRRLDEFWNIINAMQSVTAVIDYYKYQN